MPKHKETGIKGEQIAENFLLKKGYKILHRNWRFEKKEIDIIAETDGLLVFVEVKTRSYYGFGYPEDAVSAKKQEFMKLSAEEFTSIHKEYTDVRFDIISILLKGDEASEIVHIEDAFY
ncbi:MAG: YraN family protein [Bacteroidetes bacterium]|nr:YraN family protein [Bacteroidota bacterium]